MANISIDRDDCISCGSCWTICPDFFQQNPDDDFSEVVEKYRVGGDNAKGEAPPQLEELVKEAADACPVGIIHMT